MTATTQRYARHVLPNEEAWLEFRKDKVSASEAADILGVGYRSPLELWAMKTGKVVPEVDRKLRRRFDIGHRLEPTIAEIATEELGLELVDPGNFTMYQDTTRPWIASTPDRLVFDDLLNQSGLVELKSVHPFMEKEWKGIDGIEPPLVYLAQMQHQMMSTGIESGHIVAMVGYGEKAMVVPCVADPDFQATLAELEEAFLERYVRRDIPPPVHDGLESTRKTLLALYPRQSEAKIITLGLEWVDRYEQRARAKKAIKELKKEVAKIDNMLMAELQDAEVAEIPAAGAVVTWKEQIRREKARAARELKMRVLRVSGPSSEEEEEES